uniref:SKP1-like protein n=1 Tax=Oryza glumipatula TaxID=40148 RepID=A0A0E0AMX7_9ORYZ
MAAGKGKGKKGECDMAAAAAEAEKKGEGSTVSRGAAGERVVEDSGGGRRTIHLKSKDGKQHDVTEASARLSKTIAGMILAGGGGGGADQCIPTPEIDHETLRVVMQYCDKHAADDADEEDLKEWDEDFVDELDQDALFDVIAAANYLDIDGLLDLTCKRVADTIKGKTPEEIRKEFNIVNDLSKEEEEEIRRENPWAFEQYGEGGVGGGGGDGVGFGGEGVCIGGGGGGEGERQDSSDGEPVEVTEASARISKVIGDKIDAGRGGEAIPLPHVDKKTLKKVIEYCDEHANENSDTDEQKEELKNWDKAFIDELDEDDGSFLFLVLLASSYLKIDGLLDLTYQRVADNSKAKTTEEIRKAFSTIEIELSDKEEEEEQQEEEIRPENV